MINHGDISSEIGNMTKTRLKRVIGKAIQNARKENRMTQEELAEKVNSSGEHISKIERGLVEPKIFILFNICYVLNLTLNDLVQGQRLSNWIPMSMNEDLTMLSDNQMSLVNVMIKEMVRQNKSGDIGLKTKR